MSQNIMQFTAKCFPVTILNGMEKFQETRRYESIVISISVSHIGKRVIKLKNKTKHRLPNMEYMEQLQKKIPNRLPQFDP